jgi:hypothetical protein
MQDTYCHTANANQFHEPLPEIHKLRRAGIRESKPVMRLPLMQ